MANIYVTEQGAVLRKTGKRVVVQKDEEILLDVPCEKIEAILIFGNVQFTTQAVHELFEFGIELALLTRNGRFIGKINSPLTKNIDLRIAQFRCYDNTNFRLNLARTIVKGKIQNSLNLIKTFSYNHPEISFKVEKDAMQTYLGQMETAGDIDILMGIEGAAAKSYFTGLGKMILGDFTFTGRKKHPAPDAVNALLSFGYTLFFNEIASLLDGLGFDPFLGYLHSSRYGRASLASDILEEFRASADRFTLFLINNRIIKPADFYANPNGGVYLTREAQKTYFVHYEQNLSREFTWPENNTTTTLRQCYRFQAEKLATFIRGSADYAPFQLEV